MKGVTTAKKDLIYYGWFVLAAGAVSEMLAIGATSYTAGFFVLPLQAEFHLSRANAGVPVLLVYFGAIFVAPYAGRILDRYPVRLVISAGALCFAAALAAIALLSSLWLMALLLLVPAAAGFMLFGPMTTATLASRWFFRRRGLAQGIAAIALSGGGLFVAPLLSKAIEVYGWRHALLGEALAIGVIVTTLALLVLKDDPARAGLAGHPENKGRNDLVRPANTPQPSENAALPSGAWHNILARRGFWAPSLLVATAAGVCEAIVIAMPPYGHQLGVAAAPVAFLISGFSIAAALTKIAAGALADFWDKRILLFVSALGLPLSLVILSWFTGYGALLAACCVAGIAQGGLIPTSASLLAARFGAARFGSVMGWTYALIGAATIAAVLFSGTMFDRTGGYQPAFLGLLGFSLLMVLMTWLIDARSPDRATADP
jgi:MFS family permease